MFRSFIRFGKILTQSTISNSIDSIKKAKDKILNGRFERTKLEDDLFFGIEVDPEIEKELSEMDFSNDDFRKKSHFTENKIKQNEDLSFCMKLTRNMLIKIEEVIPDGHTENIEEIEIKFDLIKARLIKPAGELEYLYFISKDSDRDSILTKTGTEAECKLQDSYKSGDLYKYLELMLASKDGADDYVIPLSDLIFISRINTKNNRFL